MINMRETMANLMANWRTTGAGVASIVGGVFKIILAIKTRNWDEQVYVTGCLAILMGYGLLCAADSKQVQKQIDGQQPPADKRVDG